MTSIERKRLFSNDDTPISWLPTASKIHRRMLVSENTRRGEGLSFYPQQNKHRQIRKKEANLYDISLSNLTQMLRFYISKLIQLKTSELINKSCSDLKPLNKTKWGEWMNFWEFNSLNQILIDKKQNYRVETSSVHVKLGHGCSFSQ